MANKITDTKHYSAIADAIRAKNGSSDTYYPADMAQAIEDLPSGGMDENLAALIAGSASGDIDITLPIRAYAMTIVLGDDNSYIRRNNRDVTGLTVRGVETWGNGNMELAGNGGLFIAANQKQIRYIRLPDCTALMITKSSAYANAFENLEEFTAPKLETLSGAQQRMFGGYNATKLKQFVCPLLTSKTKHEMFYYCTALTLVDVKSSAIAASTFNSCSALAALVLRKSTLATLDATSAFTGTPIASGTGYIYVPRDLISAYESATNWSTYAGQFRAIEDYTDDGTVDGEFIMPT